MKFTSNFIAVLLFCLLVASIAIGMDRWVAAEQAIVRVSESAFPDLPDSVRHTLRKLKCLIPQPGDRVAAGGPPVNVIAGEYARAGQVDWAILCSFSGHSSIHVVWGGPIRCPTPFASAPDRRYLQGRGGSRIDFSREISAVGPKQITTTYRFHNETPPQVSHDAIDDAFVDKASVRHYCNSGTWSSLFGSD